MDFELSTEQHGFAASIRETLTAAGGITAARVSAEKGPAEVAFPLWRVAADSGWLSAAVSEADGGGGGSCLDLVVVAEGAGRFVLPIPFGWHAAVARAFAGHPDSPAGLVSGDVMVDVALPMPGLSAPEVAVADDVVSGRVLAAPAAASTDLLVVAHGDDLLLVSTGNPGRVQPTLDPTRPLVVHELTNARVLARAPRAAEAAVGLAVTCAAAEFIGAMDSLFAVGLEHARVREQFGRPIGSFQGLQHLLVDCLLDLEPARNMTYYAAYALDAVDVTADERWAAVSGAYVLALEALRDGGERIVQVLGGIGYTWESDAHLYWRRALGAPALTGPAEAYLERYARLTAPTEPGPATPARST